MTIELYVFPPSPRAFKVMVVANHLGIDTTLRMVDLVKGEQNVAGISLRSIPTCGCLRSEDGDYVLWESGAIGQYLAGKKPQSGLLPTDERGRLDVTRWQFWDIAHWDPACTVFIFENLVKPIVLKSGEPDATAIAKGEESFHRAAKVLDAQLKGKTFVTGERLTLADFSLGASMNLADMARYPVEPMVKSSAGMGHCAHCRPGRRRSRNAPCRPPRRLDFARVGQLAVVIEGFVIEGFSKTVKFFRYNLN